jgi:hypothetical protein
LIDLADVEALTEEATLSLELADELTEEATLSLELTEEDEELIPIELFD